MAALAVAALVAVTASLAGQTPDSLWQPITADGVARASAVVDSVMIDDQLPESRVPGGDFTAYLMARLGVGRIPDDLGFRVATDSTMIRIAGRIRDLPAEARRALTGLVALLPVDTRLEAQVTLQRAGAAAVRFHLAGATVQGIPIPETLLAPAMADVGKQYPALTATGRDLYVQLPVGATMLLGDGAIRLHGP